MGIFILLLTIAISTITPCYSSATATSDTLKPLYRIYLKDLKNYRYQGLMANTPPTTAAIYPGSLSSWKYLNESHQLILPANTIKHYGLTKRDGLLREVLIGSGIRFTPLIISSIFGKGEGSAYVSFITFPPGSITGGDIGATSKKRFAIAGNPGLFNLFRNKSDQ
ncbi:MAG: hypothetical protein ACXWCR_14035 [Flavitalea sp.]